MSATRSHRVGRCAEHPAFSVKPGLFPTAQDAEFHERHSGYENED
jgi:hypothetical protein